MANDIKDHLNITRVVLLTTFFMTAVWLEGKLNLTKEREGQTECVKKTGSSHDVSARRQLIIETL